MIKNVYCSSCKVPDILVRLVKLEFSWHIFEKYSKIKFHENPSKGSRVVHVRTDGQTRQRQLSFFAILQTRLKTLL